MIESIVVVENQARKSNSQRIATSGRRPNFEAPRHAIILFRWLRVCQNCMIAT